MLRLALARVRTRQLSQCRQSAQSHHAKPLLAPPPPHPLSPSRPCLILVLVLGLVLVLLLVLVRVLVGVLEPRRGRGQGQGVRRQLGQGQGLPVVGPGHTRRADPWPRGGTGRAQAAEREKRRRRKGRALETKRRERGKRGREGEQKALALDPRHNASLGETPWGALRANPGPQGPLLRQAAPAVRRPSPRAEQARWQW